MTQVTTISAMLNMALLFAQRNGFKLRNHKDMDEQPADFNQTMADIQDDLFKRIEQGQRYACLYFNTDLNQFNLDAFDSHEEMIAEYTDNGNHPTQLIMASFTMPLDNEPCSTNLFTLEIVLG